MNALALSRVLEENASNGGLASAVSTPGRTVYAYLMNGPGQLVLGRVADPFCGEDEIVLQTEAVSVCSTDVSYFRGHLRSETWPVIPGHEYIGRVVEVGSRLAGAVEIGDRVGYWGQTDFGGLAEYRVIRPLFAHGQEMETSWYTDRNFYDACQAASVIIPPSLPSSRATLIEPLTSVLRSLLVNPPTPGDICVVLGCGPSALLAIQVLDRYLGAGSVLVLDRDDARMRTAMVYGASMAFNAITQADELDDFVRSHHDQYADYVFDGLPNVTDGPSEGRDVRDLAMGLLRPGGQYVVYGATNVPQRINTWMILAKGLRVRATPFDVRVFSMRRSGRVLNIALRLIESGLVDVSPLVTTHVALGDEASVVDAFVNYGAGGAMKTSMLAKMLADKVLPANEPRGVVAGRIGVAA
jgi:threonine dehydrogenase-like Zn-dependent dehydrogenase